MEEIDNLNQNQQNRENNINQPNHVENNNPPNNLNENNLVNDINLRRPPPNSTTGFIKLNIVTIDNSIKLFYSKNFIYLSLLLSFGILWYLHTEFSNKEINLKDLESEDMLFTYFLFTIVSSILIWNIFLFIHKALFKLEYQNIEEVIYIVDY